MDWTVLLSYWAMTRVSDSRHVVDWTKLENGPRIDRVEINWFSSAEVKCLVYGYQSSSAQYFGQRCMSLSLVIANQNWDGYACHFSLELLLVSFQHLLSALVPLHIIEVQRAKDLSFLFLLWGFQAVLSALVSLYISEAQRADVKELARQTSGTSLFLGRQHREVIVVRFIR